MGDIPAGKYSHMGMHVPGSHEGASPKITTGKFAKGGGKLGRGKGSLKKMMVWHDTGKRSSYGR